MICDDETFLQDLEKFLGAKLPNLSKWFSEKEIDFKRYDIAQIIRRLAEDQYKAAIVKEGMKTRFRLPKIRFSAERAQPHEPSSTAPTELAATASLPGAKPTKSILIRKNSSDRDPRRRVSLAGDAQG